MVFAQCGVSGLNAPKPVEKEAKREVEPVEMIKRMTVKIRAAARRRKELIVTLANVITRCHNMSQFGNTLLSGPVKPLWGAWGSFSSCSTTDPHTCGTKYRTRRCNQTDVSNPCEGTNKDIEPCSGGRSKFLQKQIQMFF